MSVTIRLSRTGRKNQPTFKLVVSNTKDKRYGKFVDILGYYNPFDPKQKFSYDKEKFEKWKKQGALVTTAVDKLISGKYEFVKYDPKKIKEEKEKATKEKAEEKSNELKKTEEIKEDKEEVKEEEKVEEKSEEAPEEKKQGEPEEKEETPGDEKGE